MKKIEDISHELNIDTILKCLWAIKDNDKFYFNSYGKELIERLLEQKFKKDKFPDIASSETKMMDVIVKGNIVIKDGKSDFILGWRKCFDWLSGSVNKIRCKSLSGKIVYAYHVDESGIAYNKNKTLCIGHIPSDLKPCKMKYERRKENRTTHLRLLGLWQTFLNRETKEA